MSNIIRQIFQQKLQEIQSRLPHNVTLSKTKNTPHPLVMCLIKQATPGTRVMMIKITATYPAVITARL